MDDTGFVFTDNTVCNGIFHAARMSVTDVLQSIGMDVPDRERLGWLGDVSQYSEAAMRMLDMTAFFENELRNEVGTLVLAHVLAHGLAHVLAHALAHVPAHAHPLFFSGRLCWD